MSLYAMLQQNYLQVYDALRYQWESGRDVRKRLRDEHDFKIGRLISIWQ